MIFKVNDCVEIIPPIRSFQPEPNTDSITFGFPKIYKQFGKVIKVDGNYITVRQKYRKWEVECYLNELRLISKEEYKISKNFSIKV